MVETLQLALCPQDFEAHKLERPVRFQGILGKDEVQQDDNRGQSDTAFSGL